MEVDNAECSTNENNEGTSAEDAPSNEIASATQMEEDKSAEEVPPESTETAEVIEAETDNRSEVEEHMEKEGDAMQDDQACEKDAADPLVNDPSATNGELNDDNESEDDSDNDESSDSDSKKQENGDEDMEAEEVEKDPVIEETLEAINVEICNCELTETCFVCKKEKIVKYSFTKTDDVNKDDSKLYVCADKCYMILKLHTNSVTTPSYFSKTLAISNAAVKKFVRKCRQCMKIVNDDASGRCSWEAMDFCMEFCLNRYQFKIAKACYDCTKSIDYQRMGKYAVRFGRNVRQFCSTQCLNSHKGKLCICAFCQLLMVASEITMGTKYFCTELCKLKYVNLQSPERLPLVFGATNCYMCEEYKPLQYEFDVDGESYYFCGNECFVIFRHLHNALSARRCRNCWKYAMEGQLEKYGLFYDDELGHFCSEVCQQIHVIARRRITPCVWCKVKKYNFDMIQRHGLLDVSVNACSLYCLNQLKTALDHVSVKGKHCAQCNEEVAICEISVTQGGTRSFCSNKCITEYQSKNRKRESRADKNPLPVITSVCSLAGENQGSGQPTDKKLFFIQEELPPEVANKMCMARPLATDQSTLMVKEKSEAECQTDLEDVIKLRTVPVPIYIPQPLNMWQYPLPRALPFPLPVPVPILVPLTRDSSTEYLKTMKRDTVKTPTDPFEAELLMMAELVAAEKPKEECEEMAEEEFSPEPADTAFNDDVLQMALKMASDYQEPAVDLEGALTASTITPGHHPSMELTSSDDIIHTEPLTGARGIGGRTGRARGRGRGQPRGATTGSRGGRGRGRATPMPAMVVPEPAPPPPPPEPVEKPDANMCLKYTFGVNAWKQWVTMKNAELERSSRKLKLFNNDLLQMTADELNYSLCLFVNEVRKPNGSEYAPDTIYYLCLGIQQYLYESGRIDNIFCDSYYEKFTDCLDDVCSKFSSLYNDSHYIVTRVEEEHLWESKQLGAHSPFVLLTTLMFFNTKHFNLTSVDEHMQLSFSHIMKHWKRNPGVGGSRNSTTPAAGRNVLLRFYPPQNPHEPNSRKRKVYEQQENEGNPLRCPVKLYEFYLSKCPESVKTRNDVFYLLPERSCVPESPVWYSTMALDLKMLRKMLHRVKMIKEINVALLTH